MPNIQVEEFEGIHITDDILKSAAKLFSENYGVWGPLAEEKIGVKEGSRVKMGAGKLRRECLPSNGENIYLRVLVDGTLTGNVFATRWKHEGKDICWITQLCIALPYRNNGLSKFLLHTLHHLSPPNTIYGILSSHPFAIASFLRVFGNGIENIDFSLTKNAKMIMESCPVRYVAQAKLKGILFDEKSEDGSVFCADTAFWVDHEEPEWALEILRKKGVEWPLRELGEGLDRLPENLEMELQEPRARDIKTITPSVPLQINNLDYGESALEGNTK